MKRTRLRYVLLIIVSATMSLFFPTKADADAGSLITAGVELYRELRDLLDSLKKGVVLAKAKVDGPDNDDTKVSNTIRSEGLAILSADTGLVIGGNDKDDNHNPPGVAYNAGVFHVARAKIVAQKDKDGQWGITETSGKALSFPDDDPQKGKENKTRAAAVAIFSENGKTPEYCYKADSSNLDFKLEKIDCERKSNSALDSSLPEFYLETASVLLAGEERFRFITLGSGQVLIEPQMDVVDLFHTYLQKTSDFSLFPVIQGDDDLVRELKKELYQEYVTGTEWVLSEDPAKQADLTIVGAALRFRALTVVRNGRSNQELLEEYFSSSAIEVIAPQHAQIGYEPQVILRQKVRSGQDITDLIGQEFVVPTNEDPDAGGEDKPLAGLIVAVQGGIDDAVALALNTEGHFVRDLFNAAWDGVSNSVEFKIPGANFHREITKSFSDRDTASQEPDDTPPICHLYGTTDGGIEILAQDTGTGLRDINTLQEENADVNTPEFSPGTTDPVIVTATKEDRKKPSRVQLEVTDMEGNSVKCDPVLATVRIRPRGGPSHQTFTDLPEAEGKITVRNGSPGLKRLYFEVNGVELRMLWLRPGETRILNVSSAMLPGDRNVITVTAFGPPRASASVMIHD